MPKGKKKRSDKERLVFLADRMAILLVICKQRHGGSWVPWFKEGMYDNEGSLGDELRQWPAYQEGLDVIRLMLRKFDEEKMNGLGAD